MPHLIDLLGDGDHIASVESNDDLQRLTLFTTDVLTDRLTGQRAQGAADQRSDLLAAAIADLSGSNGTRSATETTPRCTGMLGHGW